MKLSRLRVKPGSHHTTTERIHMNNKSQIISVTLLALGATLVLVQARPTRPATPPAPDRGAVERGKYLVKLGGCTDCHTAKQMTDQGPVDNESMFLAGHPEGLRLPPPELKEGPWFAATAGMTAWTGPWGISYAANLTPDVNTGLGIWTEEMFMRAMRTGKHMGHGRDILPPMPWQALQHLTDEDLKAIYAYLRSVPAVRNEVPQPVSPAGPQSFE
jgi:mono/diheme cytochrome c family protein